MLLEKIARHFQFDIPLILLFLYYVDFKMDFGIQYLPWVYFQKKKGKK